jgi:hypothetical protein
MAWGLASVSSAQNPQGLEAQRNLNVVGAGGIQGLVQNFDGRYQGVVGSPHLLENWTQGDFVIEGKQYTQAKLKYNVFSDELVFLRPPQNDSVILSRLKVEAFTLNDGLKTRQFKRIEIKEPPIQAKYYEVMNEGKTQWLIHWRKTILKANYTGAYNAGRTADEFIIKDDQFILKADGTLHELKKNKKTILKILSDKQAEIEKYLKEQKINLNEQADLIKLLDFYNSL